LWGVRCHRASSLVESASARGDHVPPCAAQQQRTILIGVALKNRHYVNKALKRLECKNRGNLGLLHRRFFAIAAVRGRARTSIFFNWLWVDCPHGVYYDDPPGPGTRPFFEDRIAVYRVLQA
jgi:hypothetical protein